MAGSLTVDTLQADSTSTLVIKNGVANTPPTIQDSAGTQIGTFCRAWVSFNGTTGARNGSFNVSSVTRNSTGNYTVTFTNALPDANYALTLNNTDGVGSAFFSCGSFTTLTAVVNTRGSGGAQTDLSCSVSVFR